MMNKNRSSSSSSSVDERQLFRESPGGHDARADRWFQWSGAAVKQTKHQTDYYHLLSDINSGEAGGGAAAAETTTTTVVPDPPKADVLEQIDKDLPRTLCLRDMSAYELLLLRKMQSKPSVGATGEHVDGPSDQTDAVALEALMQSLRRVLIALARRNSSVGYVQSMNFIAALLLLVSGGDEERAFWILAVSK